MLLHGGTGEEPASKVVGPERKQVDFAVVAVGLKSQHGFRESVNSLDVSGVGGRNCIRPGRRSSVELREKSGVTTITTHS